MRFTRTRLPSGARVVTETLPNVRSVTLGFWVGAGSRDESPEVYGAAHLLEHLLFKGNERWGARGIAEAFDAVGGEANAFATKEYTCAYARVLDEDVPLALEILWAMVMEPSMRAEHLESEKRVVLEEIAMLEDSPEDLVHQVAMEKLLGDHPLGHEIMGTVESVSQITREPLARFHDRYYIAPRLVVAAAGNVDHVQVADWVGEQLSRPAEVPPPRSLSEPQAQGGLGQVTKPVEQTHISVIAPGYPRDHEGRFALGVLDNLLGGGMASRLFQEIREERGLAYSVYSFRASYTETGVFGVYAATAPSNADEVRKIIEAELDKVVEEGITAEELERAKGHMKGGLVLGLEDPSSRMTRLGKNEVCESPILSMDELIERVEAVTIADVSKVAIDVLSSGRVTAIVGPDSQGLKP